LWSVGKGGGRRPQWLETSVRWRIGELPRILIPRTPVNKDEKRKDRGEAAPALHKKRGVPYHPSPLVERRVLASEHEQKPYPRTTDEQRKHSSRRN
jgi:hypothetical protein